MVILLLRLRSDKTIGKGEGRSAIHVSELIKQMKEDCILIYIFTPLPSSALSSIFPWGQNSKALKVELVASIGFQHQQTQWCADSDSEGGVLILLS